MFIKKYIVLCLVISIFSNPYSKAVEQRKQMTLLTKTKVILYGLAVASANGINKYLDGYVSNPELIVNIQNPLNQISGAIKYFI